MQSIAGSTEPVREQECVWSGDITWREAEHLRSVLFVLLAAPGSSGVELDVRRVESIDPTGVAILVAASHRAAAAGRRLALVDSNGPVTAALARAHLLSMFRLTQVITPPASAPVPGALAAS
jgi:anti-anti-sigma factor